MSGHLAEVAARSLGQQVSKSREDTEMLKAVASRHLVRGSAAAHDGHDVSTRVENLSHAAAIAELCMLLGLESTSWFDTAALGALADEGHEANLGWWPDRSRVPTAADLYEHALDLLGHFISPDIADSTHIVNLDLRAHTFWLYSRACRIEPSRPDNWLTTLLSLNEDRFLAGTCNEYSRHNLECERLVGILQRNAGDLRNYLSRKRNSASTPNIEASWWRGRLTLVEALVAQSAGLVELSTLAAVASDRTPNQLATGPTNTPLLIVHELNAALCAMDTWHLAGGSDDMVRLAAQRAVSAVETLLQRWRVLARSQSPLARVLRRCLGDIAALCAERGDCLSDIGFRVSLLVKQNSIGQMIQDPAVSLPRHIHNFIRDMSRIDAMKWSSSNDAEAQHLRSEEHSILRQRTEERLKSRLHLLSLDYLDPRRVRVEDVVTTLRGRAAVDYVFLESSSSGTLKTLYRTYVTASGEIVFTAQPEKFSTARVRRVAQEAYIDPQTLAAVSDWLIPSELAGSRGSDVAPAELLISPHGFLETIPWAALPIGADHGTLLVKNFVIALVPCLANVSNADQQQIGGPALVHLVADEVRISGKVVGQPLDLSTEATSWGMDITPEANKTLSYDTKRGVALGRGELPSILKSKGTEYGLIHIAAHGAGQGLRQRVYLPDPLTAGEAFELQWPAAAILAVCHTGELKNDTLLEPLAFCIAVLAGGSSAVLAGIGEVSDIGAGFVAGHIVRAVRSGATGSLPELLRQAQLSAADSRMTAWTWSRFVTYIR